jgi:cell division protein FtsB
MKEKIKNLFIFMTNAWTTSSRGKFGIILFLVAFVFFIRIFVGNQNIQSYVINIGKLNHARRELTVLQTELKQIQHHIYLLQRPNPDSDYIEELGLKTMNLGNPEFKELKY